MRYAFAVVTAQGDGETLLLWKQLWALAFGLDNRSKHMVATIGVSGLERLIIRFIGQRPRSTPGMVASTLNMNPSKVSRIVRRLEERRYVTYRRDADDRRRVFLVLTLRGLRIDREPRGTVEAAVRRTLQRLDARMIAGSAEWLDALTVELRSE